MRQGYIPALDGLRGMAAMSVVLFHLGLPFMQRGWLGVDAFFVLSGFLITLLICREWEGAGKVSLHNFYMRRILRLQPALILIIIVCFAFVARTGTLEQLKITTWGAFTSLAMVSNWGLLFNMPYGLGLLSMNWSLSVEDQFYLIWPPLLVLLLSRGVGRQAILRLLALFATLSMLLRLAMALVPGQDNRLYYGTDTRADGLLLGCIVGLLFAWDLLPKSRTAHICIGVLLAIGAAGVAYLSLDSSVSDYVLYFGGLAAFSLWIALFIVHIVASPARRLVAVLTWRPLVWLGTVSYSLYLWNGPVIAILGSTIAELPGPAIVGLRLLGSVAMAAFSYYIVERPISRLRYKFR